MERKNKEPKNIMEKLRLLKLEKDDIKTQKIKILTFLEAHQDIDKYMKEIYKGTKNIFNILSEDNPILHEYIDKTFIHFGLVELDLDVPHYTILELHTGNDWDIDNSEFDDNFKKSKKDFLDKLIWNDNTKEDD